MLVSTDIPTVVRGAVPVMGFTENIAPQVLMYTIHDLCAMHRYAHATLFDMRRYSKRTPDLVTIDSPFPGYDLAANFGTLRAARATCQGDLLTNHI